MSSWLVPLLCRAGALLGRLLAPLAVVAALIWLGAIAVIRGVDGGIDAPLALTGVAVSALGLTGCALWIIGILADHRRSDTTQPPL